MAWRWRISEEAAGFYQKILERAPRHVPAMFRLGAIQLAANEDSGLSLMKRALELDPEYVPPGLEAIQDYLYRNGLAKDLAELKGWVHQQEERHERIAGETGQVSAGDRLVEARLSPETRRLLKEKLDTVESLQMVLIASKELEHSEGSLLILGMTSRQHQDHFMTRHLRRVDNAVLIRR